MYINFHFDNMSGKLVMLLFYYSLLTKIHSAILFHNSSAVLLNMYILQQYHFTRNIHVLVNICGEGFFQCQY